MITNLAGFILGFALQMALIGLEINQGQLAPNGGDRLWLRLKFFPSVCWYLVPSKYADAPKPTKWQGAYEAIYDLQTWHIKAGNVVQGDPAASKALCAAPLDTDTSTMYPSVVIAPPPVVPVVIVPPFGTMTTSDGKWTFGTQTSAGGNALVLNGNATGGYGSKLTVLSGKTYTFTIEGKWYLWANGGWTLQTVAPK